jgi:hypothetical protein
MLIFHFVILDFTFVRIDFLFPKIKYHFLHILDVKVDNTYAELKIPARCCLWKYFLYFTGSSDLVEFCTRATNFYLLYEKNLAKILTLLSGKNNYVF